MPDLDGNECTQPPWILLPQEWWVWLGQGIID
jgi:hypothetical protein